ncbi:uncharacterized protein LOC128171667 [Crassostrea angulata]|uniref:uncharacterized protein LOC128171667 n=1 Tax=Magallana angulata TaxID=2784310 RepID=UPI0022B1F3B0|nr:uncharacterized protein LOC128171667 [Crassostrea angulata]
MSNCSMNEKCIPKPFGQFECVLSDCGIPSNEAFSMEKLKEWDGIGITRGMHITCSSGYDQQGSEFLLCQTDGSWKTSLNCTFKAGIPGCFDNKYRNFSNKILEEGPFSMDKNGKLQCKSRCFLEGSYKCFGLQYGKYCFCGNEIKSSPNRVSDGECKKSCRGNSGEWCGGSWKMYIFKNK